MQKTRQPQMMEHKQSLAMCKNMTKLTFSSILSARAVLNPDCFKKKPFAGGVHHDFLDCVEKPAKGSQQPAIQRRSNKSAEENENLKEGFLLQQWMDTGVYEAIDKQYLKSLSLIIAKSDNVEDELSDEVLENYTIKYQYADNGDVLMATNEDGEAVVCNKENMLAMATQMLRNLAMFGESLPDLPHKRTVVLKLKYYPHTPADYEPQFFRAASSEAYNKFNSKPKRVLLGGLSSGHHALSLSFTGADWLFEEGSDEETYEDGMEAKGDDELEPHTPISQTPNSQESASTASERDSIDGEDDVEVHGNFEGHPEVMDEHENENMNSENEQRSGMRPPANSQQTDKQQQRQVACEPPPLRRTRAHDVDELESHFGRLDASGGIGRGGARGGGARGRQDDVDDSAGSSGLEDIEDTFDDDDKTLHEDEEEDDDKTRLDEDESSEDDEAPTQLAPLPAQRQAEITVLDYLHGKKSASVSVLSIMVKMDELVVSALLDQLALRGLVAKKGGGRWSAVASCSGQGPDDLESIMSDSQMSMASSRGGKLPLPLAAKAQHTPAAAPTPPKPPAAPVAPTPAPPSASATAPPLKAKAAPKSAMPPPPAPATKNKTKKRAALESLSENLNDSELPDEFDADPYDLGGVSLSQCSQSSQGLSQSRSKYSVAEIHQGQSKKRRSGYRQ